MSTEVSAAYLDSERNAPHLTYYFWSHTSPSLIWVELSGIDLRRGSAVRSLDPRGPGLVGDVTARLAPAALTY